MILYLDTSALIKLYINEEHRDKVTAVFKQADIIATHSISFVETHAAFARLHREKKLSSSELERSKNSFVEDWKNYLQIGISSVLLQRAADFTEAFSLRAYDSVHLAAAGDLLKNTGEKVVFACFDKKLNQAAKVMGLELC